MAGDAGRLVDDEEIAVFEHDRLLDLLDHRRRRHGPAARFGGTHGRNTHLVARMQTHALLGALAVYAHLAGAQYAVNQALGDAFELADQEIVDALAVAVVRNLNQTHAHTGPGALFGGVFRGGACSIGPCKSH